MLNKIEKLLHDLKNWHKAKKVEKYLINKI